MGVTAAERAAHEIAHGRLLAEGDPERAWGWATPAGQLRARRRSELLVQQAGIGPTSRVLEVGCGTGLFTAALAATGADVVAVDVSDALLERARARGLDPAHVRLECARIEVLGETERFDAVVGSSVLHHLDLRAALPQIHDLLNPGGWMVFAEPNGLNPQVWLERRLKPLRVRRHLSMDETAFSRWAIAGQLTELGFEDVKVTPFDWLHPSTPGACIRVMSALGNAMERVPLVREFAGCLLVRARRGTYW